MQAACYCEMCIIFFSRPIDRLRWKSAHSQFWHLFRLPCQVCTSLEYAMPICFHSEKLRHEKEDEGGDGEDNER